MISKPSRPNTRIKRDLKTRITRLLTACTGARDPFAFCTRAYLLVQHASRSNPHLYHLALAIYHHRSVLVARASDAKDAALRLSAATNQRDRYLQFYGFPSTWNRK